MRWALADDEHGGQPALFGVEELLGPQRSTGRLSELEFLPVTAKTVLNRVGRNSPMPFGWTINAYRGCSHACTYCFARPSHEYLGLSAGEDFDRKIVVKVNAIERLRVELSRPSWRREHVAMGTNTDPYQRAEGKYRLTRGIIGELSRSGTPFSILTKSALPMRDLDVLTAAAEQVEVSVTFSIGTLDVQVWRATEPGAPHPARRIDAIRAMAQAGIRTGALIAPVLPGLSDRREQLRDVVEAVTGAGGAVVGSRALYLQGATREHFLGWLAQHDPALHARYREAFAGRSELGPDYQRWVSDTVAEEVRRAGGRRSNRTGGLFA
ncbi:radical SAM protein [Jatrophihabitans telluris]|uniref:Radical SAM protein n=1 Tax=Jatrophihabitans telluris TaxID=2038343 RepID=A0ABY4R0W9_9ACTN|nr:radical SAM protein [Jatrophihabitans telluris]UQX89408.1 radical SAM protein [Jatrophihabitans telluris]